MKVKGRQIWCIVGDDYELISYDSDTPCRKGNRLFLLEDATLEDGDFDIYSGSGWFGPVGIAHGNYGVRESMAIHFLFPQTSLGHPTKEDVESVRKIVEMALSTDDFKDKVRDLLHSTKISVVGRDNVYYGDW